MPRQKKLLTFFREAINTPPKYGNQFRQIKAILERKAIGCLQRWDDKNPWGGDSPAGKRTAAQRDRARYKPRNCSYEEHLARGVAKLWVRGYMIRFGGAGKRNRLLKSSRTNGKNTPMKAKLRNPPKYPLPPANASSSSPHTSDTSTGNSSSSSESSSSPSSASSAVSSSPAFYRSSPLAEALSSTPLSVGANRSNSISKIVGSSSTPRRQAIIDMSSSPSNASASPASSSPTGPPAKKPLSAALPIGGRGVGLLRVNAHAKARRIRAAAASKELRRADNLEKKKMKRQRSRTPTSPKRRTSDNGRDIKPRPVRITLRRVLRASSLVKQPLSDAELAFMVEPDGAGEGVEDTSEEVDDAEDGGEDYKDNVVSSSPGFAVAIRPVRREQAPATPSSALSKGSNSHQTARKRRPTDFDKLAPVSGKKRKSHQGKR